MYDVIIAGAGPVGLFLACELALAPARVLILEQSPQAESPLKRPPFGIRGLSAPSIAALHRHGLLAQLRLHQRMQDPFGTPPSARRPQAGHFAGIPLLDEHIDSARWNRPPGSLPLSLLSSMEELDSVLTTRALELGVDIRRGQAVSAVEQGADAVRVQAGAHCYQGRWLAGCDGGRSAVRKLGGFEFAGTEPEFTGYSIQADVADPQLLQPGRNLTATGMYFQSQPGYFALQDFDGGAFHDAARPVTLQHAQQVLRRVSGTDVTLAALHAASTWTDRARQATRYRDGRILLAGDAAHIHSPLGGQGLNLGLGDAVCLGARLAAVLRGAAPDSVLDSYHDERHPVGAAVLDWSRAQVAVMRPGPEGNALRAIFRDLLRTRDGATYVAARLWGLAPHAAAD
ncbi:FAD-dependent monooxygenase [Oxalobacteraceae bacterium A2-2]